MQSHVAAAKPAARYLVVYVERDEPNRYWHHGSAETQLDAEMMAAELREFNPGLQTYIVGVPLDRQELSALMADTHELEQAIAAEERRAS